MRGLCAILASSFLIGCGTPQPVLNKDDEQINETKAYKMDLELEVNKVKAIGMISVPQSEVYDIKIRAPGDSDHVAIKTCAGEEILRKQDDVFKFRMVPTGLEKSLPVCDVKISAFALKFRYAGGYISFAKPGGAPAKLSCNRADAAVAGSAVCQSPEGTFASIEFEKDIDQATPDPMTCPKWTMDGLKGTLRLAPGGCHYYFREREGDRRGLHLQVFGYKEFSIYR